MRRASHIYRVKPNRKDKNYKKEIKSQLSLCTVRKDRKKSWRRRRLNPTRGMTSRPDRMIRRRHRGARRSCRSATSGRIGLACIVDRGRVDVICKSPRAIPAMHCNCYTVCVGALRVPFLVIICAERQIIFCLLYHLCGISILIEHGLLRVFHASLALFVANPNAPHSYGSGEPGKPPCERCIREQHECILGGSRRGGKRVKRTHEADPQSNAESSTATSQSNKNNGTTTITTTAAPRSFPPPAPGTSPYPGPSKPTDGSGRPYWSDYQNSHSAQSSAPPEAVPSNAEGEAETGGDAKMTVHESIASADIQNPSDALEFLANVADRAEGRMLPPLRSALGSRMSPMGQASTLSGPAALTPGSSGQLSDSGVIEFAPLQRSQVNLGMIHELLARYGSFFADFGVATDC